MRAHELTEYESGTDNSAQIFAKLKSLGYERLGSGQDATVWSKDEASVIKILMPSDKPDRADNGFLTFYNFCQAHPSVNLPKFVDIGGAHHSVFEINGTPYRQIAMEKLSAIKGDSVDEWMVWALSDLCKTTSHWKVVEQELKDPKFWVLHQGIGAGGLIAAIERRFERRPEAKQQFMELFNTMRLLFLAGKQVGLGWDLHTENVMQRKDGTLVIVDPFYS